MVEAESPPASLPSNAISASSKSPLEMPLSHRHAGAFEARDSQAGKTPLRHRN
jgi:hypothetical protein